MAPILENPNDYVQVIISFNENAAAPDGRPISPNAKAHINPETCQKVRGCMREQTSDPTALQQIAAVESALRSQGKAEFKLPLATYEECQRLFVSKRHSSAGNMNSFANLDRRNLTENAAAKEKIGQKLGPGGIAGIVVGSIAFSAIFLGAFPLLISNLPSASTQQGGENRDEWRN